MKIEEAKVERAVAKLRLQQLKKKLELQDRFGHPFKIVTTHVNQVTYGPRVKLAITEDYRLCRSVEGLPKHV